VDETASYAHQRNEGEGNKTAAREYNEAQRRFVESGKVEEKAREAARAMTSPERAELERAEAIGRLGRGQTLTQDALDQATQAGEYVARNVQEYPFAAVFIAGLVGYGIGYLIHTSWSSETRKPLALPYPSVIRPPGYVE
jgi:ElaB/YqjD/DUF883 family membrane-anchored ribosome-binding protein